SWPGRGGEGLERSIGAEGQVVSTVLLSFWDHSESLVLDHEPDQAELDQIAARYAGVDCQPPNVRVVESLAIPRFEVEPGGCEEYEPCAKRSRARPGKPPAG